MSFIADQFFKRDESKFTYAFGNQTAAEFVTALRSFADAVEKGEVALQETRLIRRSKNDEYTMNSLILRFAEKR